MSLRVQSKQGWESLLLGQISTGSKDDNDGLLLDLVSGSLHAGDGSSSLSWHFVLCGLLATSAVVAREQNEEACADFLLTIERTEGRLQVNDCHDTAICFSDGG
jgi:hypothetical protein